MYLLAKYGTQTEFHFAMVKRGVVDLAATADWTPAAADTKVSKDGGNFAQSTNAPAAVGGTGSVGWKLVLTATELQAAEVQIQIVDAATKAVEDQFLTVYTYGNASAKILMDLSDIVHMGLTALPGVAAEAVGGLFTRGTGAGQINQSANGRIDSNPVSLAGTTLTGRDIGLSVLVGDKTGFSLAADQSGVTIGTVNVLTTACILSIWHQATAQIVTAGSIGKLILDNLNAAITTRSSHSATDVWAVATRAITDKAGFSLHSDYNAAKTAASQTSVDNVKTVVDANGVKLTSIQGKTDMFPAIWFSP